MKSEKQNKDLSRREFIKRTSLSALGATLISGMPSLLKGAVIKNNESAKSKVVLIKSSNVINSNGEVNSDILKEMIETGVTNFSGEKNSANYWKKILSPNDVIGLKVNTLGLSNISGSTATNHFQAVTSSIINSCVSAGYKDENFIIWDRSEDELKSAGFVIQKEKGKVRVLGNVGTRSGEGGEGYSSEEIKVGEKSTRLSKILTEMTSAMINIPLMKDHGTAGVTGALKNHYGTINNARDFHSNNATGPGIPEINMLDGIRSKQKLIIMDALMSVFNGGPRWDRNYMWPFGGILISTDPVAIDSVMYGIINEKRTGEGLSPIAEERVKHLRLSSELGLGKNKIEEIDLVKINLS